MYTPSVFADSSTLTDKKRCDAPSLLSLLRPLTPEAHYKVLTSRQTSHLQLSFRAPISIVNMAWGRGGAGNYAYNEQMKQQNERKAQVCRSASVCWLEVQIAMA